MSMKMRVKMKNRSQRYELNRPRSRYGPKYTKYKMCLSTWNYNTNYSSYYSSMLSIMMVVCIKQYLSNI